MKDLWEGLGLAAIILALLLGFGGCYKMVQQADAELLKVKQQIPQ